MRSIVVDDKMQLQTARYLGVDQLQEANKFLMAVPRHAIANDCSIEHIQRREQGRRAIAFVVVRLPGRDSRPQRQERLSAVEGLDLTFLVDAEYQGFVGRIQIKPDHVVEFLDEAPVAAELEGFDQVRFQVVLLPDSVNGVFAQPLGLGHTSRAPVSSVGRRGVQGGVNDGLDLAVRNPGNTPRPRRILFEPRQPKRQEALTPELHRGTRDMQDPCNILAPQPLGCLANDLGALNQSKWEASSRGPFLKHRSFLGAQQDCFGHSQQ